MTRVPVGTVLLFVLRHCESIIFLSDLVHNNNSVLTADVYTDSSSEGEFEEDKKQKPSAVKKPGKDALKKSSSRRKGKTLWLFVLYNICIICLN